MAYPSLPATMPADPQALPTSRQWNALYLVGAVAMMFITLATAMQPLFLRRVLGVSLDSAGMVNASLAVAAEVLTLLVVAGAAALSDRCGRVPVLVGGFLVGAAGALLAPFSATLGAALGLGGVACYFVARMVMALGGCAIWPQLVILAGDFTDREGRARGMSNATSMMAFGSTLVFAVVMQMPRHAGITLVMLFNAALALAGAWLAAGLLGGIAAGPDGRAAPPRRGGWHLIPWQALGDLVRHRPRLRVALVAALLARGNVAMVGLFTMLWTIYFAELAGRSQEQAAAHAGLVLGLLGLLLMLTSLGWGRVVDRLGRLNAIGIGMAVSAVGFVSMGLVVNPFGWLVLLPMSLIALGQAGALLAPDVIAFDEAPQDMRGAVMGALNAVGGLGMVVLLEAGGVLFDRIGPFAPFVMMGACNLLVMAYVHQVARGEQAGGGCVLED
ncbi:Magnetosome protein MamH [Rhodovastum atsumiense]|uniref:MFS transporter n=1 Tax=Rhodovastum atsumiense TaxID=504468 RepID=A0A5M6IR41_9PROT|nr:magnetosome biogenesis transporter MamH [Rhodovastum atsumiense]KAA5609998.1 MFS transporter [Rhodovastum atsumiense]CAH2598641.1 Magnetosome protein MamH [Rhodovastum atsumiense]